MRTLVLGVMAIVSGVLAETAHAQERSWPEANHDTILWSARSCYAEALWSEADCSALLHVIRKRATKAGWPFLRMLKAYSVKNWMKSALAAHKLRLGDNQDKDPAWNKKWQQLVTYVVDVLQDRVNDPCPKADHWAAAWYSPKSPMRKVRCMVPTDNQFWVSVR